MNEDRNFIVTAADWIFSTIARVLASLFNGMRHAVEHATPSLFGLVATLLPYLLPLPVAWMTSHSAQTFFGWDAWAAWILGLGLEGLGLLVWVRLVDSIIARTTNEKIEDVVNYLWGVAISYEAVLVLINVILAFREGASVVYALTLLLICFLPALSAAMYGLHRRETINVLARETQARQDRQLREEEERRRRGVDEIEYQRQLAEKIRQERRQDAIKRAELKLQYSADTKQEELKKDKTFRKP
jgi:hypothetical protein